MGNKPATPTPEMSLELQEKRLETGVHSGLKAVPIG
jgi:hypothetical protein